MSSDGSLKWKHEGLLQFDRSVRSPSLAALDGDGKMEIIGGSDTGKLMVFAAN